MNIHCSISTPLGMFRFLILYTNLNVSSLACEKIKSWDIVEQFYEQVLFWCLNPFKTFLFAKWCMLLTLVENLCSTNRFELFFHSRQRVRGGMHSCNSFMLFLSSLFSWTDEHWMNMERCSKDLHWSVRLPVFENQGSDVNCHNLWFWWLLSLGVTGAKWQRAMGC